MSLNNNNNAASGLSVKNIIAHCTVANYCLSSILLHTVAKLQNIICHTNVAEKETPHAHRASLGLPKVKRKSQVFFAFLAILSILIFEKCNFL